MEKPTTSFDVQRNRNIVNVRIGITRYSQSVSSILDFFNLFITVETKHVIFLHSNEEASRFSDKWYQNRRNKKKLENFRIRRVRQFYRYMYKSRYDQVQKRVDQRNVLFRYFNLAIVLHCCHATKHILEISILLRIDDKSTRADCKQKDKLAAIRELWDMFVDTYRKAFESYKSITIDEQLVIFIGRCLFRQFIKYKPGQYCIKIWAAAM